MKVKSLSRVRLFATPRTVAYQAPQSMEFSKQEYWSGLPFPSPGDLPNPGIEPGSPALQANALPIEYYSVIKKNEISPYVTTCMNLEGVMLSELYQADKDKHSMISFMESNNKTNEPATQNRNGLMEDS